MPGSTGRTLQVSPLIVTTRMITHTHTYTPDPCDILRSPPCYHQQSQAQMTVSYVLSDRIPSLSTVENPRSRQCPQVLAEIYPNELIRNPLILSHMHFHIVNVAPSSTAMVWYSLQINHSTRHSYMSPHHRQSCHTHTQRTVPYRPLDSPSVWLPKSPDREQP
jgi:hypothetical protein